MSQVIDKWINFVNPPAHGRLKKAFSPLFTQQAIESIRPYVSSVVDSIFDDFCSRGKIDMMLNLGGPLTALTIAKFLGLRENNIDKLMEWCTDLDTLNFYRTKKYLGIGGGIHYCVVSCLAKLEMEVILSLLTRRHYNLCIATDSLECSKFYCYIPRRLNSLPILFTALDISWLVEILFTVLGNLWKTLQGSPAGVRRPMARGGSRWRSVSRASLEYSS